MREKIGFLAATGLLLPAVAAAQSRPLTQNEVIEQTRKDLRASEKEAARNLDERRNLDQVRLRKAVESGDTAEAMRIVNQMQGDQPLSGPPGDLKIVFGVGSGGLFGGVVPVSTEKAVRKPSAKKPAPVASAPKKKDESGDKNANGRDPKLKKELEDWLWQKRRELDLILQRKELLPKDDAVLRNDFDKEADRVRTEIRKAEKRYTDYLYTREPGEYQRYVDQQHRIHESPLEARPGEMRELWGTKAPPPHTPAPRVDGPKTPTLQEYDGPKGPESERRLEGGRDPYQADRIVAPGLNQSPGKAPSPQLRDYDGPEGTAPGDRLTGAANGGNGSVLAPGLGNAPTGPKH